MILSADIGGTKTYVALFSDNAKFSVLQEKSYTNKNYINDGLISILSDFLSLYKIDKKSLTVAGFGVAGFVNDKAVSFSNLNWTITEKELEDFLKVPTFLINDLEAIAFGISFLSKSQIININPLSTVTDCYSKAILAAGTGLGQAGLIWNPGNNTYIVSSSEGGHADFAPTNIEQAELFKYLLSIEKFSGHISYERVLSGQGLVNIYKFLRSKYDIKNEPLDLKNNIEGGNTGESAKNISAYGLAQKHFLCEKALDIFASIYGSQAGNLALIYSAISGVYLSGGIAPKIIDKLKNGKFMESFVNKGRFSSFVKKIPVYVIVEPKIGLWGAAAKALELSSASGERHRGKD